MLVAHSKCLVALDLSANPVCDDRHYAQEVIHVLPRLRYFDSVDLESANQAYSHSHSHRAASAGRGASATSTPQRRGLKADRRLPDLPDEFRSIRSGNSVSGTGTKLSYAERRQDFERRVQLALAQRRKIAALSPNSRSERSPPPGHANHVQRRDSRPRAGVPVTKHVRGPAAGKSREHDRYAAFSDDNDNEEDDQDAEMRSVQDSIQQLDSSMRRNRGGGGAASHPSHNQSGFVPTSMTQAHQLASHSGNAHREDGVLHQGELSRGPEEASENVAGRSSAEGEAGYFAHTASYHSKRRVSAPSLIEHWAGHQTTTATTGLGPQSLVDVPILDANSTLLDPTESIRNRATFYGTISRSQRFPNHPVNASRSRLYSSFSLGESYRGASAGRHSPRHRQADKESGNDESRGYFSEGELSMTRRSSVRRAATVVPHTEQDFMDMQESERYGAWHPRYRVPKPIYGFSKPFAHRHAPSLKDHAPLFDTTVQRMRDSFRRDPGRGTFSRAGKGLPGEWYPMDYSDVEAIRRQGYFHETIGEVAKDSYRDTVSAQQAQLKATHTSGIHANTSGGGGGGGGHGSTALELSLDPLNLTQNTIAQQLRSRLQAQTRSQMQEQGDRQAPVHEQDTSSAAAVTRSVTLLPMERKDSSDFSRHMQQRRIDQQRAAKALADEVRIPSDSHLTSSPIQMAAASPSRLDGAEESFQAELRAFDLPSFPAMQQHHQDHQDADLEADRLHLHEEAQRTHAIERSAEADGEVFVDIEHRIEAEEEALSNYLSWLENQHSGSTPLPSVSKHAQAAAAAAAPAVTPAAASSNNINPSIHSSGIPRYSGLSKSADGDEPGASQQSKSNPKSKLRVSADHHEIQSGDGLRVFSPRDAAMRAEQANVVEPEDGILFGSETKHNGVNPLRKLFR
eukprot:gene17811-20288_t